MEFGCQCPILFMWSTLILATLCSRYPLSWLKCASVSLFLWFCFIPTKSFGFSCSIIYVALQSACLCQVPANRQTVNLLYSCFLKWKRTSVSTFLPFPVKNNKLVQLHLGVCMPCKGETMCDLLIIFPKWISFETSKTSTIGQHRYKRSALKKIFGVFKCMKIEVIPREVIIF